MPELTEVDSSMIHSLGYDGEANEMFVRFRSKGHPGALWKYAGVPENVFNAVKNNGSVGGAFLRHVRDRYTATKLSS